MGDWVQNLRSIDSTNRTSPYPIGTGTGNITFYMGQNAGATDGRMAFAILAEAEGVAHQGMTWSNTIPGGVPSGLWYWAVQPQANDAKFSAFAVSGASAIARRGGGTKTGTAAGEFFFPQEGFYLGGSLGPDTIRRFQIASHVPVAGTWIAGDRIWNSNPAANGIAEWVCTAGGAQGAWAEVRQTRKSPSS